MNKAIKVNVKVEYESTPIRHMAVQCPNCENWFGQYDIVQNGGCSYDYEIKGAFCVCPKCEHVFSIGYDSKIDEDVSFPEFYDKCLKQKVTWE